jgi:hypothetical protein
MKAIFLYCFHGLKWLVKLPLKLFNCEFSFSPVPLRLGLLFNMRSVVVLGHSNGLVQVGSPLLNVLCHLDDATPRDVRTPKGGVMVLNTRPKIYSASLFLSFEKCQADNQLSAWHAFLRL